MPLGVEYIEIHNPLIYIDDQGNLILNTAGKVPGQVQSGKMPAFLVKNGSNAGLPAAISITSATGASANIANVTFQLQDAFGNNVAGIYLLTIYLSDAATGIGLTTTTASGGIAAASGGGVVFDAIVTSKAVDAQTNASGAFVLAITDTAKTTFYPCAQRGGAAVVVGPQLTTANYHA